MSSVLVRVLLVLIVLAGPVAHAGPASMDAPTSAARFGVHVSGQGPDVILIPGLATPGAVWDATIEALGDRYRFHVIGVYGFGAEPAAANYAQPVLAPLVDQLAAYIRAQDLRPVAVVGHSIGGLAALMLAERNPDTVDRLMVVDALPFIGMSYAEDATIESMRSNARAIRTRIVEHRPQSPWIQLMEARATASALAIKPAAVDRVARWSIASDSRVVANFLYDDMTTDVRPGLAGIHVPITVLYPVGAMNRDEGDLFRDAYAQVERATLIPVPDSRHFLMLDQPVVFRDRLLTFLAR